MTMDEALMPPPMNTNKIIHQSPFQSFTLAQVIVHHAVHVSAKQDRHIYIYIVNVYIDGILFVANNIL